MRKLKRIPRKEKGLTPGPTENASTKTRTRVPSYCSGVFYYFVIIKLALANECSLGQAEQDKIKEK